MEATACFRDIGLDAPVYLSAVTTVGLALLVVWILRHEDFLGRGHFLATVIGMILWLAIATFELATPTLACKVAAASATWPAIALVPVSWSLFMWHFCFSVPTRSVRAESIVLVLIVAAVSAAALSNPAHGLFYGPGTQLVTEAGRRPYADFDHGPLFYAVAALLYLFLIVGFAIAAIAAFRATRSLRPLMFMLMFATAVPMASNFAYVVVDASMFGFDPTPFAFSFVLLALTWAIYANRGFDVVTVARDLLYFNLLDPVVVVNAGGLVVGANAAAIKVMPQYAQARPLGEDSASGVIRGVVSRPNAAAREAEISLGGRTFNMRVLPIPRPLGETGAHLGAVAIMSDVTLLKRQNEQLAAALDRSRDHIAEISRLREIAERSAMSDPLTEIGNRRSLRSRVDLLGDAPLALALVDLDHFKQINDRLGHAAGDRVLQQFATTASAVLPPDAEVFRVGGEEFVVLLAGKPLSELLAVLGQLRQAITEGLPLRGQDDAQVTFSAGVAVRPGDGTTLDELYARADARLYQAKRNGRDRIMHLDSVLQDTVRMTKPFGKTGSGLLE